MIALIDTSVWIDHLHKADARLAALLTRGDVRVHPAVVGELACGSIRQRRVVLDALGSIRGASVAVHDEVLAFVEAERLFGKGLGWVDVQLLASARLDGIGLWTRDAPLLKAGRALGVFVEFE